jgi:hypothetical protein
MAQIRTATIRLTEAYSTEASVAKRPEDLAQRQAREDRGQHPEAQETLESAHVAPSGCVRSWALKASFNARKLK